MSEVSNIAEKDGGRNPIAGAAQPQAARTVTELDLVAWSHTADAEEPYMRLGEVNWTMIVRSLIAEVRRLRGEQ